MTQQQTKRGGSKYKKRKAAFWSAIIASVILFALSLFVLPLFSIKEDVKTVRAGICGEVNRPAVYNIPDGADLAMLIKTAKGLTYRADISNTDLNKIILNDTIYHISAKPNSNTQEPLSATVSQLLVNEQKPTLAATIAQETQMQEIEIISMLYVGLPTLFIVINYYPSIGRLSMTNIPHNTLFLYTNERLIDIFLTLGTDPTLKLLENRLKQKIDYYIIQDRSSFITLIDILGGVEVNIDEPFSQEYRIKDGPGVLNGFMSWEFIRFLDFRRIKRDIRPDNFSIQSNELELAYEMRHHRQRQILTGMRSSFGKASANNQSELII
ncbi:MAG: LCP family protein, partial [Bacteroidales bacterium]|nr:LCP family protein [Bacteroidales bacterium]